MIGDVGGTNIRLALVPVSCLHCSTLNSVTLSARYLTTDFRHLREALSRFASEKPTEVGPITMCALSVCGPVNNGKAICLSANMGGGWVLEEADLANAVGLENSNCLKLINDFVAVGLAIGGTDWHNLSESLITVHAGDPSARGAIAVLGPGTGLGSCFGLLQVTTASPRDDTSSEYAASHRTSAEPSARDACSRDVPGCASSLLNAGSRTLWLAPPMNGVCATTSLTCSV